MYQSELHPDGWGVSYYIDDCPHLIKSIETAVDDTLFEKVSGVVSSQTVLAHLRKTTIGENSILNTHPFQHGKWTFAHNGNIKNFEIHKEALKKLINEKYINYILGSTDSEIIFFILLSEIYIQSKKNTINIDQNLIYASIKNSISNITSIIGDHTINDSDPPSETFLSFILTNGNLMVCYNGGKTLHYSTHKNACEDRDDCKFYSKACENEIEKVENLKANHLIISSEVIKGSNIWIKLNPKEIVGVDQNMNFFKKSL